MLMSGHKYYIWTFKANNANYLFTVQTPWAILFSSCLRILLNLWQGKINVYQKYALIKIITDKMDESSEINLK